MSVTCNYKVFVIAARRELWDYLGCRNKEYDSIVLGGPYICSATNSEGVLVTIYDNTTIWFPWKYIIMIDQGTGNHRWGRQERVRITQETIEPYLDDEEFEEDYDEDDEDEEEEEDEDPVDPFE